MKESIELGPTPCEENCVQVSDKDYLPAMMAEVRRFVDLLEKAFPPPNNSTYIAIKRNNHDFGTYLEAAVFFDEDDEQAVSYAYELEGKIPSTWAELEELANKKE